MTGRGWYGVALAVLVVTVAGAGWVLWNGLTGVAASLVRVVVPGNATLSLDEPGTYTIFHESPGIVDDQTYTSDIAGLEVTVTAPSGTPVPVHAPAMTTKYDYGGRSGVSILAFAAAVPGRYALSAAYGGGRSGDRAVLMIEHGVTTRLLTTLITAFGLGLSGLIVATIVWSITFAKRRRLKRRAMSASP